MFRPDNIKNNTHRTQLVLRIGLQNGSFPFLSSLKPPQSKLWPCCSDTRHVFAKLDAMFVRQLQTLRSLARQTKRCPKCSENYSSINNINLWCHVVIRVARGNYADANSSVWRELCQLALTAGHVTSQELRRPTRRPWGRGKTSD